MKKILLLMLVFLGFAVANTLEKAYTLYNAKRFLDAARIFNQLCQKPNARACFSLAYMYEAGQGVVRSDSEARKYYSRACRSKLPSACFNLALLYERHDDANAANVALYEACALRHTAACKKLGSTYEAWQEGDLAVKFYDKACKFRDSAACFKLGQLYDDGNITRQNPKAAQSSYSNACTLGLGEACFVLGQQNEGQDNALARKYYGKACDLSHQNGCVAYKRMIEGQ